MYGIWKSRLTYSNREDERDVTFYESPITLSYDLLDLAEWYLVANTTTFLSLNINALRVINYK